jgi:hypothetical protein
VIKGRPISRGNTRATPAKRGFDRHLTDSQRLELLKRLSARGDQPFESQEECLGWAHEVLPLLTFNSELRRQFSRAVDILGTLGLSSNLSESAFNQARSTLRQAVGSWATG